MKAWIKYGLLNSIVGLLIGIYISVTAIGDGYQVFIIAAPISVFLTGGLFWNLFLKNNFDSHRVLITGLLTGSVSHYFTFIISIVGTNIYYWITGENPNSAIDLSDGIITILTGSFAMSFFSLLLFGLITVPASLIICLVVVRMEEKTLPNNGEHS